MLSLCNAWSLRTKQYLEHCGLLILAPKSQYFSLILLSHGQYNFLRGRAAYRTGATQWVNIIYALAWPDSIATQTTASGTARLRKVLYQVL